MVVEAFCERGESVFIHAGAWYFSVEQAAACLCGRGTPRLYLAVHHRSGRDPVRCAAPLGVAVLSYTGMCLVLLQSFAVSNFLRAS